jgi:regulator of protease activity HflC (stomatin/prohibitin superfamily)
MKPHEVLERMERRYAAIREQRKQRANRRAEKSNAENARHAARVEKSNAEKKRRAALPLLVPCESHRWGHSPEVERLTAKAEALRKSEAYAEPLPREEIVYSLRQAVDSYYEFAENGKIIY